MRAASDHPPVTKTGTDLVMLILSKEAGSSKPESIDGLLGNVGKSQSEEQAWIVDSVRDSIMFEAILLCLRRRI